MRPTLFSIGSFSISTFGFFFIIGTFVGMYTTWKQAKLRLYPENDTFDVLFSAMVTAFIGARVSYILLHFNDFGFQILSWVAFWIMPGFYIIGGMVTSIITIYFVCRGKKELTFWKALDLVFFSFWIAMLFGLFGSFIAGIERGKTSPIASIEHPVGLYRLVGLVILLLPYLTYRSEKDYQKSIHARPGLFSLIFIASFSFVFFVVDFTRLNAVYYGWLTQEQWIMALIFLISIALLYLLHRDWFSYILKRYILKKNTQEKLFL